MNQIKLVAASIIVACLVAVVYFIFEQSVAIAIQAIWRDWLHTDTYRLLVVPVIFMFGLLYFAVQHYLDSTHENRLTHSLEEHPKPTIKTLLRILALGFLSLIAGASLGPEAILVPACVVIGSYVGLKLFKPSNKNVRLLAQLGFIALFAAFFNSVFAGLLGLFLVLKRHQYKPSLMFIFLSYIVSVVTVAVQNRLDPSPFVEADTVGFSLTLQSLLVILLLVSVGTILTHGIDIATRYSFKIHRLVASRGWWATAVLACTGLSVLYLIGGPLVQFTGNTEIQPMLTNASELGAFSILIIIIVKILAISWSKALGYRGGMVFPSVFVAASVVALFQLAIDVHFVYGLVAVLVGMYLTDKKLKILF